MSKKTYDVHRSMTGDREYSRGDTREMDEADAADLVASGALSLEGEPPVVRDPAVRHEPIADGERSFGHELKNPPREPSVKIDDKRPAASKARTA